jgi:hypothetical protein
MTEWVDDFFQLKDEIEMTDLLNVDTETCKIGILSNERFLRIIEMIRNLAVEERLRKLEKICILELGIHGIPINQENVKKLMNLKVNQIKLD